jgi:hypothetical protein
MRRTASYILIVIVLMIAAVTAPVLLEFSRAGWV